jgi:hypothetical protein
MAKPKSATLNLTAREKVLLKRIMDVATQTYYHCPETYEGDSNKSKSMANLADKIKKL